MKIRLTLIAAVSLLVIVASGYAHHPFSAEYDWTKPVTIMGAVSKVEWTNPHAFLYVDAKDEQGNMKQWKLEMGGLAALTRGGWTRNTLKMGDQVTVEGWMSKTHNDWANVKSVKLPDGRELAGGSSILDTQKKTTPVSN